jgi:hypothetical protein
MASAAYSEIRDSLLQLYVDEPHLWLVGFSGGKDSTLVAALVFDAVLSIPPEQRTKPITALCTDNRVDGNSHKKAQRSQRTRSADTFSLSASNGERARVRCRFRPQQAAFFSYYAPEAREILSDLLEKYASDGELQFTLPDVLKVRPVSDHGNVNEIIANSAAHTSSAPPSTNSNRCCMRREPADM